MAYYVETSFAHGPASLHRRGTSGDEVFDPGADTWTSSDALRRYETGHAGWDFYGVQPDEAERVMAWLKDKTGAPPVIGEWSLGIPWLVKLKGPLSDEAVTEILARLDMTRRDARDVGLRVHRSNLDSRWNLELFRASDDTSYVRFVSLRISPGGQVIQRLRYEVFPVLEKLGVEVLDERVRLQDSYPYSARATEHGLSYQQSWIVPTRMVPPLTARSGFTSGYSRVLHRAHLDGQFSAESLDEFRLALGIAKHGRIDDERQQFFGERYLWGDDGRVCRLILVRTFEGHWHLVLSYKDIRPARTAVEQLAQDIEAGAAQIGLTVHTELRDTVAHTVSPVAGLTAYYVQTDKRHGPALVYRRYPCAEYGGREDEFYRADAHIWLHGRKMRAHYAGRSDDDEDFYAIHPDEAEQIMAWQRKAAEVGRDNAGQPPVIGEWTVGNAWRAELEGPLSDELLEKVLDRLGMARRAHLLPMERDLGLRVLRSDSECRWNFQLREASGDTWLAEVLYVRLKPGKHVVHQVRDEVRAIADDLGLNIVQELEPRSESFPFSARARGDQPQPESRSFVHYRAYFGGELNHVTIRQLRDALGLKREGGFEDEEEDEYGGGLRSDEQGNHIYLNLAGHADRGVYLSVYCTAVPDHATFERLVAEIHTIAAQAGLTVTKEEHNPAGEVFS